MGAVALFLIAATLLMGCFNVALATESGVIHVVGKVLCQDCTHGYNEWRYGGKPIQGAKVSITCMDDGWRVLYYASDVTDHLGHYDIPVKTYVYGKKLNTRKCAVRLVSSPDQTCNVLTDFAGGKKGVKLSLPTMVYRDLVKHILQPLYFTSPMCEEPDWK